MVSFMFYQDKRDGFARIGEIEGIRTPTMVDYLKKDVDFIKKINFGKAPYAAKFITDLDRSLLPDGEIKVLTGLSSLSPRELVRVFDEVRGKNPLYAVASATPKNVSLLIYLGVDIVDNILAISKAHNGIFFADELEIPIAEAKGLCSCKYCEDLNFENVAKHNSEVLRREVEKCRRLIEKEELRNYVESKVKIDPELTAALRISDFESEKSLFSRFKKSKCYFSSLESSYRFEVKNFLEKVVECYEGKTKTLLILPCTAKKPYFISKTHRLIREAVKVRVNEIIVSSPLVVPREFELIYPACNYDTPVTGYWSEDEIESVAYWLRRLVEKGKFERIVAHVEGGYKKVVERALRDYDVHFTVEDNLLSERSLNNLNSKLEDEEYNFFDYILPQISKYQFGISFTAKTKGKYPELEFFRRDRVARIDTIYGMLDVYGEFAKELIAKKQYLVRIDNFIPKGTIFAAGVIEADEKIRPNDTVVFCSDEVYGVGIALMSGKEMVENDKGAAVKVKRVEKI